MPAQKNLPLSREVNVFKMVPKGRRSATARRWRAERPSAAQRRMTEAGALWAASVTFEPSNMPSELMPAQKTSRFHERFMFFKMVPKGRFELPTKGL